MAKFEWTNTPYVWIEKTSLDKFEQKKSKICGFFFCPKVADNCPCNEYITAGN